MIFFSFNLWGLEVFTKKVWYKTIITFISVISAISS